MGYKGQNGAGLSAQDSILLADLADAILNIPLALANDEFDLSFHTDIMLGGFEEKHRDAVFKPLQYYRNHLESNQLDS